MLVTLLWTLISPALCHVALKYPPARKYDLDFLDSFRTSGDCGMNGGQQITQLETGAQVNMTWHLGYPHGGGYRIELLRDGVKTTLVPEGGAQDDWEASARFAQSHLVTIPKETCQKCAIRLLRQATEWGKSYQFRSCSDVSILPGLDVTQKCGNHGTMGPSGCKCEPLWSGLSCQYGTMCQTDQDCNGPKGQGSCVLLDNSIYPDKMCLCKEGWFGVQCEKENQFSNSERTWTETGFTKAELGLHTLLWRIEDDEVEMLTRWNTLSWVGVGWRPAAAQKSCQRFPSDAPTPKGSDFHAMDCMDMVIGRARGAEGSVADYYSRDRSTPRRDSFWGGEDDLLSGSVWEKEGTTYMRFRKKITSGLGDHPFQGKLTLVWAVGQQDGFYLEDQLKYHGKQQRGITVLDIPTMEEESMGIVSIGLIISFIILFLILLVQFVQNADPSCSLLSSCMPSRRNKFYPN